MRTRYLFFDIDGTLAENDAPPSAAMLDAFAQLAAAGHRSFLCTGRTLCDVYPAVRAPQLTGVVCGAGAHILLGEEELYKFTLPLELARETVALFLRHRITCVQEGTRKMWEVPGEVPLPWTDLELLTDAAQVTPEMELQKFTLRPQNPQVYEEVRPFLEEHYHVYPHPALGYAEAVHKSQTKATAMRRVLAHYGAGPEDAIAFGDSTNDADMLALAGVGVAMGHAPEALRAAADYVTGTLEQDGAYTALRHLELIR